MTMPEATADSIGSAMLASKLADGQESGRLATRRQKRYVLGGASLLTIFACWWSTQGADLSDDAHNIALAWRLSLGDAPFVDEMNTQTLGALLAVPFTWLWTHLFGMSGLVLASRIFFLIVAFSVGTVAYIALRQTLRPVWGAADQRHCRGG